MRFHNLVVATLFGFSATIAFAEGGGDRTHQRVLDLQEIRRFTAQQEVSGKNTTTADVKDEVVIKKVET